MQPEPLSHVDSKFGGFPRVRFGVAVLGVERRCQRTDGGHVALLLLPPARFVFAEKRAADPSRDVGAQHGRHRQHQKGSTVVAIPAVDKQGQRAGCGRQQGDRGSRPESIGRCHEDGRRHEDRQDVRVNAAGSHQHEPEQDQPWHDDHDQETLYREPVPGEKPTDGRSNIRKDGNDADADEIDMRSADESAADIDGRRRDEGDGGDAEHGLVEVDRNPLGFSHCAANTTRICCVPAVSGA